MKNFTRIFVLIFLGLSNAAVVAQGTWSLQNNPTSKAGESMQFVSANEGWIGLSSNQLLHTINSGQLWSIVTPNDTDITFGLDAPGSRISFINPSTGWVMKTLSDANENTLGAVLYKTTDSGLNWDRTVLSTTAGDAGIQVQFVDADNGWLLIYNMITGTPTFKKTTDGGTTWTTTNGGGIFYYVNASTGYSFSAGPGMLHPYTISKTIDGGTNWTPQYVDNTAGELNAIQFTDVNNGWIVGNNGKIFHTTDGGINWTPITNSAYNSSYDFNPLSFLNNTTGWIAYRNNSNGSHFTLSTTDGGATWSTQTLPFVNDVYAMNFWDVDNGWATSDSYNNNGTDYPGQIAKYSVSSGSYSNATLNGPWFIYTDVTPIEPRNDNLIYFVFDGNGNVTDLSGFGGPWTGNYTVSPNGIISGNLTNGSESFPMTGQLTSNTEGTTQLGGQNWRLHKVANPGALQDKIEGYLATQFQGRRDVTLNIDSQGKIISAYGLAAPVSGKVYADLGVFIGHLTTGENSNEWKELTIRGYFSSDNLSGEVVLDSDSEGMTIANLRRFSNPIITTDWKLQTNPVSTTAELGKIQFVSTNEGWISISLGGLLHTTDGGTTWTEVPLDLPEVVLSSMIDPAFNMCFINPSTGWVLKSLGSDPFQSNGAVVYKTTNGGLNWQKIILSQVPKDMGGQIQFIDENNGYASIVNMDSGLGKYYKTTDGGTTWSLLPSDGTVGIFYSVDLNNAWGILGTFTQTPPFKILHSNNGMTSFSEQKTDDSPGAFWAIQFTDLNHGWVVGQNGKILKTTDGGVYWDPITNAGITSDYTCKSVYFMNSTTGWIGAQHDGSSDSAIVLHTTNGGTSWTTQSTPAQNPYSIFFSDVNNGWFTSEDNQIASYTGSLDVKENIVNKFITIYPNPNNGTFYFSLKDSNSKVKAEIFNLSGQKVYEASNFEMKPQNEINFAPQATGIYLIKITDGENSYSEKIMIK